jgi:hypothetical protein
MFLGLVISIAWFAPAKAAIEMGVVGQSGWSDNFYLADPNGWGIFVSKSLSTKLSLRFAFNRLDNAFRHIGIMQFGFPPPEPDTTREFIHSDVSVNVYEISIHHALVEGTKMRLEAGGGIGQTDFDLHLKGESTGKTMSSVKTLSILKLSVNVTVKRFIRSPFAMRLGYQYRKMSAIDITLDGFEPFTDVNLSSIYAAVLARW